MRQSRYYLPNGISSTPFRAFCGGISAVWWWVRVGTAFREACGGRGLDRSSLGYPLSSLVDFWKLDHGQPSFSNIFPEALHSLLHQQDPSFGARVGTWLWYTVWQTSPSVVTKGKLSGGGWGYELHCGKCAVEAAWIEVVLAILYLRLSTFEISPWTIFFLKYLSGSSSPIRIPCFINVIRVLGRVLINGHETRFDKPSRDQR